MTKQMCWLPTQGSKGDKVLHLKTQPNQPWQHYKAFPTYAVPDYRVPGGSKGWATYQKLMKQGWRLISTAQAQEEIAFQDIKSA